MSSHGRLRAPSPGGRRLQNPMSASANTVYSSSFDPRYSSARASVDTFAAPTRISSDRVLEAQPISTKTYIGPGHAGPKSTTQYAVRPRRNTLDLDPARIPRPSSVISPRTPTAVRPVVTSERPGSPHLKPYYPSRDDADRYVLPATSSSSSRGHRRNYSTGGDDSNRPLAVDRDRAYHERAAHRAQKAYPVSNADAYSYTGPREQFDRDFGSSSLRPARRDSLRGRERPSSMIGLESLQPPLSARREGPPPSQRGFDRLEPPRYRSRTRANTELAPDVIAAIREPSLTRVPARPHSRSRAPVVMHQAPSSHSHRHSEPSSSHADDHDRHHDSRHSRHPEDHRSSHHTRDEHYDDRRHRTSRDDPSDHEKGLRGDLIGGALSAIGLSGGLAALSSKDSEHDRRERDRRDRDRDRDADRSDESPSERERRHRERASRHAEEYDHRGDRKGSSESDEHSDRERRRRHEEKHRERELRERDRRYEREHGTEEDTDRHRREDKDRSSRYAPDRASVDDDVSNFSSNRAPPEEERPKQVTVVEPVRKEPEAPPKSILKPPRERFPEEPNPVREGVAPLKEAAGKKGIPPGARWTKIDRRLVNPAALTEAQERFEERSDYVIVLRVLTKEEIQKFAEKTQEIRAADIRYEAERAERHERRRLRKEREALGEYDDREERRRQRRSDKERRRQQDHDGLSSEESDTTEDESDSEHKTPLGIEAPPPRSSTADPSFGLGSMATAGMSGGWRPEFEPELVPNMSSRQN